MNVNLYYKILKLLVCVIFESNKQPKYKSPNY